MSDDDALGPPEWVNAHRAPPEVEGQRRKRGSAAPTPSRSRRRSSRNTTTRTVTARQSRTQTRPPAPRAEPDRAEGSAGAGRAARRAADRAARSDRGRRRRRTLFTLAIVFLPIVLLFAAGGWFVYELNPHGKAGPRITVTISKRSNAAVGGLLEKKGVIGSARAFEIYTKITGNGPFKPGTYRMRTNIGVRKAVNALKVGPESPPELTLTLPPGLTINQIADRVAKLRGHSRDKFLAAVQSGRVRSKYEPAGVNSLEGLLYPDTYFVGPKESELDIVARLVQQFDAKADALGIGNPNPAGLDPYQTIVAASLIEREAGVDEDRPLISAVIRNRLRDQMPLQIDATLCYAKGGCTSRLTDADKLIASPYNTYANPGLPPTPISGVTDKSVKAARSPANVPFKFYVLADKSGKHAFGTTPEEHDKNVEEARRKGLL